MTEAHAHAGRVLRNTGLGGLHQAIATLVGFLLLPYMLVRLGEVGYGVLLIVQILSLNGLVAHAEFGVHSAVVRELAFLFGRGDGQGGRHVLTTGFWAFVLMGVALGATVLVIGDVVFFRVFRLPLEYRDQVRVGYWLYAATFWLHFPLRIIKGFLTALQDFVVLKIWETVERVTYGIAVAAAVTVRPTVVAAIVAELAAVTLVAAVFILWVALRYRHRFTLDPRLVSANRLTGLVHLGGHMFFNHLSFTLAYTGGPNILVATFLGPSAVARLAIVVKIPRAIKAFSSAANAALFPAVSSLRAQYDSLTVRRLLARGSRYGYAVLTPLVAFVIVYAEAILRAWIGPEYTSLGWLLRGYVLWQFLQFLPAFLRSAFTGPEEFRQILGPCLVGNLLFVGIGFVAIGSLGLWAIWIGLMMSGFVALAATVRVHRHSHGLLLGALIRESVVGPVVAGGSVAVAVFALFRLIVPAPDLFILGLLLLAGSTLYGLAFYWGVMAGEERSMIHRVLRTAAART